MKRISWIAISYLMLNAAHAGNSDLLSKIAGNYYGGPSLKDCVITLPEGKRRCNCLSIKKESDTTARISFDRHDSPDGYVCSGEDIAKVVGEKLVLCPEKIKDQSDCITITSDSKKITFNGGMRGNYCGLGAMVNGMTFSFKDRVQSTVSCGP